MDKKFKTTLFKRHKHAQKESKPLLNTRTHIYPSWTRARTHTNEAARQNKWLQTTGVYSQFSTNANGIHGCITKRDKTRGGGQHTQTARKIKRSREKGAGRQPRITFPTSPDTLKHTNKKRWNFEISFGWTVHGLHNVCGCSPRRRGVASIPGETQVLSLHRNAAYIPVAVHLLELTAMFMHRQIIQALWNPSYHFISVSTLLSRLKNSNVRVPSIQTTNGFWWQVMMLHLECKYVEKQKCIKNK